MSQDIAEHIQRLQETLIREHSQAPGLFGEIARMEKLLAETYRSRVFYELLQNSDDAGSRTIEIHHIGADGFRWSNDGRTLDPGDIEALCRSASSTKQRGGATIGYRGIGFKSLAVVASNIEIRSADASFRFDRAGTAALLGEVDPDKVPLIRVPTDVRHDTWVNGVSFTVTSPAEGNAAVDGIDPISLLFLRNIESITFHGASSVSIRIERQEGAVVLHDAQGKSRFAILGHDTATIAVPLDARALALTGVRGRLACFLPLNDEIGIPVIVSGDLLTDPSRTHAVVSDDTTHRVLTDAASLVAAILRTPDGPVFQRFWELILQGEDLRSALVSADATGSKVFLSALREIMTASRPTFTYSSIPLEPEDVQRIFPEGAPSALYTQENQAAARALKAVLGLNTLEISTILATLAPSDLSATLRDRLALQLTQLARTHGRQLTPAERQLVDSASIPVQTKPSTSVAPITAISEPPSVATRGDSNAPSSLAAVLDQWRTAEIATMEYLNARGWSLNDVSKQNVGYDLEGINPRGESARVEVKKVSRPDDGFSMTNNEMSLMQYSAKGYFLALLVGEGSHSKLMLLDPSQDEVPRERVCRRWDWYFTDWARFAVVVD